MAVVERFGKFSRLAEAGCVPLLCPIEFISGRVSLKVQGNTFSNNLLVSRNLLYNFHHFTNYIFTTTFYRIKG